MSIARIAAALAIGSSLSAALWAQPLVIVNNQAGTFIDISPGGEGTGEALGLNSTTPVATREVDTISNALFNIAPSSQVVIHNNGGISFNNPNPANHVLSNTNQPIASHTAFNGQKSFIAFWDDIDSVGDVYFDERENDRLIIQWHQKGFENAPPNQITTFQVQIFDDNPFRAGMYAQYLYADVEGVRAGSGASATIGYQNDGTPPFNDFEWSFNAPAVSNGTVLSLIPEPASAALMLLVGAAMLRRRA